MEVKLKEVVAISGKPGLYRILGNRPAGLLVEGLDEKRKKFPTSITQKVSVLTDISIYTYDGDVRLADVFKKVDQEVGKGLELITKKNSNEEIHEFFRTILPDFDEDQVYTSDIVKVSKWYGLLKDVVDFNASEEAEEESSDEEE